MDKFALHLHFCKDKMLSASAFDPDPRTSGSVSGPDGGCAPIPSYRLALIARNETPTIAKNVTPMPL